MLHRTSRSNTILACLLVGALVLVGCGSSSSHPTTSPPATTAANTGQTSSTSASNTATTSSATTTTSPSSDEAPTLDITLKSPVKLSPIPARYTCDGADVSLPISWRAIPTHTAELDLFVFTTGGGNGKRHVADWAVAGLKPSVHRLTAGHLPAGVILGRNGIGQTHYSICPPKGTSAEYLIHLFALPHKVTVNPGFDAAALESRFLQTDFSEGLLTFTYKRR